VRLVQLRQAVLALLVDGGHAFAKHCRDLVTCLGAGFVDQAGQQRPPFRLPDVAQIADVGDPGLACEVRDLPRRDAAQPLLGRAQRVEIAQVGQAELELAQRRGFGR